MTRPQHWLLLSVGGPQAGTGCSRVLVVPELTNVPSLQFWLLLAGGFLHWAFQLLLHVIVLLKQPFLLFILLIRLYVKGVEK